MAVALCLLLCTEAVSAADTSTPGRILTQDENGSPGICSHIEPVRGGGLQRGQDEESLEVSASCTVQNVHCPIQSINGLSVGLFKLHTANAPKAYRIYS